MCFRAVSKAVVDRVDFDSVPSWKAWPPSAFKKKLLCFVPRKTVQEQSAAGPQDLSFSFLPGVILS